MCCKKVGALQQGGCTVGEKKRTTVLQTLMLTILEFVPN